MTKAIPLCPGDVLDQKYRLIRVLGEGAFGQVWQARDTLLGARDVAIKFLKTSTPDKDGDFLVEMRALAALNLSGIVAFHHHFKHEDQLALVMECCAGGTLAAYLRHEVQLDSSLWVSRVTQWMVQLCNTLAVVHARGWVHHDIKPSNILLREDSAVIADFGIVNTTGGTVVYSSPEKSAGLARRDDGREDVYALGVMLLELLAGHHPWAGFSGAALKEAKVKRSLPDGLAEPSWLIEIALKAIAPDAALRFQSAADMAAALRSRSVPVSVNRNALQAHRAVLQGGKAMQRGQWHKAEKASTAALHLSPALPSAILLAARIKLLQHLPDAAFELLEYAAFGSSAHLMSTELGWLYLQRGELILVSRNPRTKVTHLAPRLLHR